MTTHYPSEQLPIAADDGKNWGQVGFLAIAILFNLCLVAQLLTVGLAVFSDASWWQVHVWLVRGYGGMAVLLLMGLFVTPFPKRVQTLTKVIVILLLFQFATAHIQQPLPLGVLHPLTGFTLFTTSTTLVHRAMSFVMGHSEKKNDEL
ncbi:MAG: DUF6220 domain-containing protein [Cyanobacteria bacterium P01_D01_bin.56]